MDALEKFDEGGVGDNVIVVQQLLPIESVTGVVLELKHLEHVIPSKVSLQQTAEECVERHQRQGACLAAHLLVRDGREALELDRSGLVVDQQLDVDQTSVHGQC